jgi:hypothetical protein
LSGERFVMGHNESRSIEVSDDVCHCKGFSRTGNAFETLHFLSGLNALDQCGDCLRLIARRLEGGLKRECHCGVILPQSKRV